MRLADLGRGPSLFRWLESLVVVTLVFLILSWALGRQANDHLAGMLAQSQGTLRDLGDRSRKELLRISGKLAESPALRATRHTFTSETSSGAERRPDLLATLRAEVERIRDQTGKDLAVLTDENGTVLAASPDLDAKLDAGRSLDSFLPVSRALRSGEPGAGPDVGVLSAGGDSYQVGSAPIVMEGRVVGALGLGERMDRSWLQGLKDSIHSDVVLLDGERVAGSTLTGGPAEALAAWSVLGLDPEARAPLLIELGPEQFVTAPIVIGLDDSGRPSILLVAQSLTRSLRAGDRTLLAATFLCAGLAILLSRLATRRASRSVLAPLERSVEVERVERLKVSEKLAALGGTLSRAVHEINDPMAAIVGNLDLLMRFDRLKPRIRGRLKVMDEEAHRVVSVVRSLLESAHRDTRRRSPVEEVRPIGPTMEPEPLPLPPEIAAGDPATVLVVDDEPNIVELQRAILDSIGVATIGVASGAEAVGWLSRRDFHAVVSDLRMPGDLSGEDLFGWVESHRPEMAGRFLFVTGDTASEATQQFLERSRRRFVAKPFRMQEYLAAVRETLASANPPGEG